MNMNKDLIIAFVLGIMVGWGVFKFTASDKSPAETPVAQEAQDNTVNQADNSEVPGGDIAPPPPSLPENGMAAAPSGVPTATPPTNSEGIHRNINLELTEEAVDMLENSITELHQAVTVERDNEGFILHFESNDNYFASIGLANNDRIPFTQFEEMRQNPETQELASRIETILSNLEK
ncbi:hypothetical protein B9G69_006910 [Bdellovibrio sp. SKB1291214]|uniref:hypothetical protein n=1 Tax=Bdellovibrio sp. SKB1291214 TaxID=1732569 RepID=UPI001C3C628A|nr:hypothetical protein [Bdellovibrio sp. SKB1291214]UYL10308.1 hypothetical protein B9G69_006910 [Bdellovibrio sp. SKB1291214]